MGCQRLGHNWVTSKSNQIVQQKKENGLGLRILNSLHLVSQSFITNINKFKSPFCFSRTSIIWLHPKIQCYISFPAQFVSAIRSQNCCWGKMGRAVVGMMGWGWDIGGWVFHRYQESEHRRWRLSCAISYQTWSLHPLSWEFPLLFEVTFSGGWYKIMESDTIPSNLPIPQTQMLFL